MEALKHRLLLAKEILVGNLGEAGSCEVVWCVEALSRQLRKVACSPAGHQQTLRPLVNALGYSVVAVPGAAAEKLIYEVFHQARGILGQKGEFLRLLLGGE